MTNDTVLERILFRDVRGINVFDLRSGRYQFCLASGVKNGN